MSTTIVSNLDVNIQRDTTNNKLIFTISNPPTTTPPPVVSPPPPSGLYDDFQSGAEYSLNDGTTSPDGKWYCKFKSEGYAQTKTSLAPTTNNTKVMFLQPRALQFTNVAGDYSDTRSVLVMSTKKAKDFEVELDIRTISQNRKPPNNWETAWLLFKTVDDNHSYYVVVKNQGCELGKEDRTLDPTREQIFLQTKSGPSITLGKWAHWKLRILGINIKFWVDNVLVFDVNDSKISTKLRDSVGNCVCLYCEDAAVEFDNVKVTSLV